MDENLIYYLWMKLTCGASDVTVKKLVDYFGSAQKVYAQNDIEAFCHIEGMRTKNAEKLAGCKSLKEAEQKMPQLEKSGIECITYESGAYPEMLQEIYDPPAYLFYKGTNVLKHHGVCIAVVGSRKATEYGRQCAYSLSGQLAQSGITVVSGLAYGIDSYSHKGACDAKAPTVAVLGSGTDRVYPKVNRSWYCEILETGGMVMSEFLPDTPPANYNFPRRNRIISALSYGTLVVEAGLKSGSLITAKYALEQGREVYAVPGNITSEMSEGTNKLIKDGAKPVACANDILEDLFSVLRPVALRKEIAHAELTDDEALLMSKVVSGVQTPDALAETLGMSASQVSALLTAMELKQAVSVRMGTVYAAYRR